MKKESTSMLAHMIQSAQIGGDEALSRQGSAKVVFDDGGGGLTTDADHATQAVVIAELKNRFPDIAILAEEQPDKLATGHRFIVDPIDATVNYEMNGMDWSCTIAHKTADEIDLGVIYQPRRNIMVSAMKGDGCRFAGEPEPFRFSSTEVFVPTRSVIQMPIGCEFTDEWLNNVLIPLWRNTRFIRNIFSNTGSIIELLRGPCVATILTGSLWDIAAGKIIVEEAGGVTGDVYGNPIDVNLTAPQNVVLARSQQIFDSLIPLTSHWPANAMRPKA